MNLADVIAKPAASVADRAALIVDGEEISYRRVAEAVRRASGSLHRRGVRPRDRMALADACGLLAVAAVLGAARIGAAAAPMNPSLTTAEMEELARRAGCGAIGVAGEDASVRLGAALGAEPLLRGNVLDEISEDAPRFETTGDEVAVILFTGGTTGVAKPVAMSHETLTRRVAGFAQPIDPAVPPAIALMCVPFHHVAGLVGVLVGLAGGTTTVVQRRFDAGAWLRLAEQHRVSRAFLVPTMLHRIVAHPEFGRTDLSSLGMVTYGAAPAPPDLIARAVDALPHVSFVNVFGQTETLGAVTALGPDEHRDGRIGSVGRPLPGVEIRIVDPSTEADVVGGEIGELWVRAPHTASPGWVRTGDLVRSDTDGYLHAAGRLSDVINRGGEKISPAEVEAALLSHPSVSEAAVTGFADEEMGERIGAVVVTTGSVNAGDLIAWCRSRIAPFKLPERIVVTDSLPLTDLGKISRPALRRILDAS